MQYLISFFLLLVSLNVDAQNDPYGNFLRNGGYEFLSLAAHPSNTYVSGSHAYYRNGTLQVKIYSKDAFLETTMLTTVNLVPNEVGLLTRLYVVEDTDPWGTPPFLMVEVLKEIVDEALRSDPNMRDSLRGFEQVVGKRFERFTGVDTTLFILNMAWIGS